MMAPPPISLESNGRISRRTLLRGGVSAGLGVACSVAAAPWITPVAHAAAPGENRLVVIILRGAMDGLDVVAPYGDATLKTLRPTLARGAETGAFHDDFFAWRPGLEALEPLWRAEELAAVHAVSTPYRDGRSHFDGQDILENGAATASATDDGWLNRALAAIPGAAHRTDIRYAVAVGQRYMLLLEGEEPASAWAPSVNFSLNDDERGLLARLYADDPLFASAAEEAALIGGERQGGGEQPKALARYAAERLNAESRIAAFSVAGWDTHQRQARAIKRPLRQLTEALLTLRETLGANWERTAVLAITEFGRTARENGVRGTDHGAGGAALLAGGAIRGGRVYNGPSGAAAGFAGWPGLAESDLYEDRDLRPTEDVRRIAAWLLAGLFGAPASALTRDVFPGLEMGRAPHFIA